MGRFQSVKIFDGYTITFRQWRASDTHCHFLHGYAVEFRVTFTGSLDSTNWVWDFGGLRRTKGQIDGRSPLDWFKHMFDHTTLVADDDPYMEGFKKMHEDSVIDLRVMKGGISGELLAKFVSEKLQMFLDEVTEGRVSVSQVELIENKRNSATYSVDDHQPKKVEDDHQKFLQNGHN